MSSVLDPPIPLPSWWAGKWIELDLYFLSLGIQIGEPRPVQTTGGGHSDTSFHYLRNGGLARDYGYGSGDHTEWPYSDVDAVCDAALELWHQGKLMELYYAPRGLWFPRNVGAHQDHAHVAIHPAAVLPIPHIPPPALIKPARTYLLAA